MNDKAKTRLYALTSLVCTAWVIQTIVQALEKGNLWTWLNLIFYGSMFLVILYTAYSAFVGWKALRSEEKEKKKQSKFG